MFFKVHFADKIHTGFFLTHFPEMSKDRSHTCACLWLFRHLVSLKKECLRPQLHGFCQQKLHQMEMRRRDPAMKPSAGSNSRRAWADLWGQVYPSVTFYKFSGQEALLPCYTAQGIPSTWSPLPHWAPTEFTLVLQYPGPLCFPGQPLLSLSL